uniref:Uncharacterized protein n=1 Tax=Chenopodium quinoa TaxID=63459 RepID=A0A803LHT3_CHEQI
MAYSRSLKFEDRSNLPELGYIPKHEFPKFEGTNPRMWIKKYCKYFTLCKVPDDQKVDLPSLNMVDKAKSWVYSYLSTRSAVDWNDFVLLMNHKCQFKEPQLFTVAIPGLDEVDTIIVNLEEQEEVSVMHPFISFSALTGITHNFVDIHLAEMLGCKSEAILGCDMVLGNSCVEFKGVSSKKLKPSCPVQVGCNTGTHTYMVIELNALKSQFAQVFEEPTYLPPKRCIFDYRINLDKMGVAMLVATWRVEYGWDPSKIVEAKAILWGLKVTVNIDLVSIIGRGE